MATAGILLGDDIYVSMCYRSKTKMISNVLLRAVTFIFRCYGIRKFDDQEALTLLVFQMLRYRCLASVLGYMMGLIRSPFQIVAAKSLGDLIGRPLVSKTGRLKIN